LMAVVMETWQDADRNNFVNLLATDD